MPSRRRFLAALGSGLAAGYAAFHDRLRLTPPRTVTGSWSHVGRTPNRASHAPDGTGPDPPLTARWEHEYDDERLSSPVVADGRVYVGRLRHDDDGNRENAIAVTTFDAASGNILWDSPDHPIGDGSRGYEDALTVADDTVYLVSRAGLHALDATDGTERWRFTEGDEYLQYWNHHPTVANGVVYTGTFGEFEHPGSVFAVDAEDGSKRWEWTANPSLSGAQTPPAVADGTVFTSLLSTESGGLVALDAESGEVQWVTEIPANTPAAVSDGQVFVSTTDAFREDERDVISLRSFDADTGEELWRQRTGHTNFCEGVAVDGERVYQPTMDGLYAHDRSSGAIVWTARTGRDNYLAKTTPAIVDEHVYICNRGTFLALNAASGEELAAYDVVEYDDSESLRSAPAVVDGVAYVTSSYGRVYAIDSCTVGGGDYCLV